MKRKKFKGSRKRGPSSGQGTQDKKQQSENSIHFEKEARNRSTRSHAKKVVLKEGGFPGSHVATLVPRSQVYHEYSNSIFPEAMKGCFPNVPTTLQGLRGFGKQVPLAGPFWLSLTKWTLSPSGTNELQPGRLLEHVGAAYRCWGPSECWGASECRAHAPATLYHFFSLVNEWALLPAKPRAEVI